MGELRDIPYWEELNIEGLKDLAYVLIVCIAPYHQLLHTVRSTGEITD